MRMINSVVIREKPSSKRPRKQSSYFPFGFEGRMWDLIVSVPDHYLSFYFKPSLLNVSYKVSLQPFFSTNFSQQ